MHTFSDDDVLRILLVIMIIYAVHTFSDNDVLCILLVIMMCCAYF